MAKARVPGAVWFASVGIACVLAGGLLAAATAHSPTRHGVWAVAYLVLVAGVAQVALGWGQALLATETPTGRLVAAELLAWNIGNAAVIIGTLIGALVLVYAGGALLVTGLVLFVLAARGGELRWRRTRWAFRLIVLILAVSIPVGLTLATARG
ncbi:MAG: hypothetical protein ABI384_07695 [Allobranchiibius sp.]